MSRSSRLIVIVSTLVASLASAQTIEKVGGTTASESATSQVRGNSFAVTSSIRLDQIEVELILTAPTSVTFYVYEQPAEFGTYRQVFTSTVQVQGAGAAAWYSSPPVNVALKAGTHALIAAAWRGPGTCFYDKATSSPVSFGWQTHGFRSATLPLPLQVMSTRDFTGVFSQRLTTTPVAGSPSATAVGTGSFTSAQVPVVMLTDRLPALGNVAFKVSIENAPPASHGWLAAAVTLAPAPIALAPNAKLYLDPGSAAAAMAGGVFPIPFNVDPSGRGALNLPVPSVAALSGMHIYIQAAVADPSAPASVLVTNAIDCLLL